MGTTPPGSPKTTSAGAQFDRLAALKRSGMDPCRAAFKALQPKKQGTESGPAGAGEAKTAESAGQPAPAAEVSLSLQAHALLIGQAQAALTAAGADIPDRPSLKRADGLPEASADIVSKLLIHQRDGGLANRAGAPLEKISPALLLDVAQSPGRAARDTLSLHSDDIAAPTSTVERRQAALADTLLRSEARQTLLDLATIPFEHEEHALMALADFMREVSLTHPMSGFEFQGGVQKRTDGYHVSTKIVIGAHHTVSPCRGYYNYHAEEKPENPYRNDYRVTLLHSHPIAPEFGSVSDGACLSTMDLGLVSDMGGEKSLSPFDQKIVYQRTIATVDVLTGMVTSKSRPQEPVAVIGCLSAAMTNDVGDGELRRDSETVLSGEAKRMQRFTDNPQDLDATSPYDHAIYDLYYGNLRLTDDMRDGNARHDRIGDDLTLVDGIEGQTRRALLLQGVFTLGQLAASDPEELAARLEGASEEAVTGWIERAKILSNAEGQSGPP